MCSLFGDVATELAIICDGDEGLLVSYENVELLAPLYAGDYIEAYGRITKIGHTSRRMEFEARKVIAARPDQCGPLAQHLCLPSNTTGVMLSWIPDRLANEALPPLPFVPVRVRSVSGLAVEGSRQGDYRMVSWSELGNVYWLVSDHGDITDLVRLADSLR